MKFTNVETESAMAFGLRGMKITESASGAVMRLICALLFLLVAGGVHGSAALAGAEVSGIAVCGAGAVTPCPPTTDERLSGEAAAWFEHVVVGVEIDCCGDDFAWVQTLPLLPGGDCEVGARRSRWNAHPPLRAIPGARAPPARI